MLTPTEFHRYGRHLALAEVGLDGQERLKRARVLIVGAGGLGSPASLYLAAAGVGVIGLMDSDQVELANLQRQILHDTSALGRPKTDSGATRLRALNPEIEIRPIRQRLTIDNARGLFAEFDFVLDGTDNFPTRYLINDAAVLTGKPYLYGSIARFEGQVSVFGASGGPCYRCLFPEPPPPGLVPNCADAGVLGVLPGVIGTLQAVEAIKLILGLGRPLIGRLLCYDALAATFRDWAIHRDAQCVACGDGLRRTELMAEDDRCPASGFDPAEISGAETARAVASGLILLDVREPWEFALGHIAGSVHIPLDQLEGRIAELDPQRPVVAICHRGARSRLARGMLIQAGFQARSLRGGIDGWSADIDPAIPRY